MYILYVFARQNTTGIASSRGRVSSHLLGLAIGQALRCSGRGVSDRAGGFMEIPKLKRASTSCTFRANTTNGRENCCVNLTWLTQISDIVTALFCLLFECCFPCFPWAVLAQRHPLSVPSEASQMKWKAVAKMKGGHTVDGKDPAPVGNYWVILDNIGYYWYYWKL